jgi:hypothetical protein
MLAANKTAATATIAGISFLTRLYSESTRVTAVQSLEPARTGWRLRQATARSKRHTLLLDAILIEQA